VTKYFFQNFFDAIVGPRGREEREKQREGEEGFVHADAGKYRRRSGHRPGVNVEKLLFFVTDRRCGNSTSIFEGSFVHAHLIFANRCIIYLTHAF